MDANPLLGVLFHWLGGLSSASFYVPYKRIRRWSWEIYWITGGLFSWLIVPWLVASVRTDGLLDVLGAAPIKTLFWCWFWGVMWGFGGLTFGLTMRYLGLSLGMAVALGLTTIIGTLGPPIFHGTLLELAATPLAEPTDQQVLVHCQIGEDLPALRYPGDPEGDQGSGHVRPSCACMTKTVQFQFGGSKMALI